MTQLHWNRVPREQAATIMAHVSQGDNAAVFSEQMTEVTFNDLPFYGNFKQYRLTNYATLPCFTMDYIGDAENGTFFTLDGLANTIYDVNDAAPISLTRDNVVSYLDFFFEQVRGPDGDIYLIKDPADLPMLDSLPDNQKQRVIEKHQSLVIDSDIKPGEFHVSGTLYYGGSLISANISIIPTGQLSIHNQILLLQGIHFPQSPVQHTYMSDG